MSNKLNKQSTRIRAISVRLIQIVTWPFVYILLKIFLPYKVIGKENIKLALTMRQSTGIIFASNHITELDPVLINITVAPYAPLEPMFFVTAPFKNFKNKKFGFRKYIYTSSLFKAFGAFPIIKGTKNYVDALSSHKKILKSGYNLCLFPEGGMNRRKESHGGISYLAAKTNSIVLPIRIQGITNLTFKDFIFRRKKVVITYMKPLFPKHHIDEDALIPKRYQDSAKKIIDHIYSI